MLKEELAEHYRKVEAKKYQICQALEKLNEKKQFEIQEKGDIVCTYTCQRCKRNFVTNQELKIVVDEEPFCAFCKCGVTEYTYLNKDIPTDIS